MTNQFSRRQFLIRSTLAGSSAIATNFLSQSGIAAPAIVPSEKLRPKILYGVASGDITQGSAVIWSRSDRPARMMIEYAFDESFRKAKQIQGPVALAASDYTARFTLTGLPNGESIFYRVRFQDLEQDQLISAPVNGSFRTVPKVGQNITFAWGGDTAGQGWGINPDFGGMKIYEAMRRLKPDFFIHSGDTVYTDVPIQSEVKLPNGQIWRNLVTEEKSKVAETLKEFRGNYLYNLMDENVRRFNAEVPQLVQWDDHEVRNNWYPNQIIEKDDRYKIKDVNLLATRARQAFQEYVPMRLDRGDPAKIYRAFNYGALLDIFMLDERSYRGKNSPNRQSTPSTETAFLGNQQLQWLKQQLIKSNATWKVIASDMPIGLVVRDGPNAFEAVANGDGMPLGRELELVELLRFIKRNRIRNIVWLTADVHYAAAHYYDPNRAQFQDFHPFWEFVTGPLHSGTFGPNDLDNTFGPQVKFRSVDPATVQNLPPSAGLQFFGLVKINAESQVMTVSQHNLEGKEVYRTELSPERSQ
jgi:alkaline phosphatase D